MIKKLATCCDKTCTIETLLFHHIVNLPVVDEVIHFKNVARELKFFVQSSPILERLNLTEL